MVWVQLKILFDSLIMSVFSYGIEVWACACGSKYLSKADKFCRRAWTHGYTKKSRFTSDVTRTRDKQLWQKKIKNTDTHCLKDLRSKRTHQS